MPNPSNSDLVGEAFETLRACVTLSTSERDGHGALDVLAQQLEQAEQRITNAGTLLARADEHEFNGTTAKNGDAHQLVKQARVALTPDEGADPPVDERLDLGDGLGL